MHANLALVLGPAHLQPCRCTYRVGTRPSKLTNSGPAGRALQLNAMQYFKDCSRLLLCMHLCRHLPSSPVVPFLMGTSMVMGPTTRLLLGFTRVAFLRPYDCMQPDNPRLTGIRKPSQEALPGAPSTGATGAIHHAFVLTGDYPGDRKTCWQSHRCLSHAVAFRPHSWQHDSAACKTAFTFCWVACGCLHWASAALGWTHLLQE